MPNPVYDKEDSEVIPGHHDDLGVHPERREAEAADLPRAFDAPSAEPASNKELAAAESSGADSGSTPGDDAENSKIGGFYSSKDSKGKGPLGRFLGSKRGKWIGVGVGGTVVGITLSGFFILPMKVMHITENLHDTFFASSEQAAEEATNRLFSSYVIHKVLPGLSGTCPSTHRDKSCAVVSEDSNVVSQLYRSWRDSNLEGKLAKDYGLEIRREGNNFYVRKGNQTLFSGTAKDGDLNGRQFQDRMFAQMNRKEVRKEFLTAIEKETFYKRIMYRYKYGRLMERKYGVVRCLVACDFRQDRADRKELRKMRMKAWVIHRVILPLNEGYALAFECAVAQFDCTEESKNIVDEDGTKKTEFENKLRERTKNAIGDGRMTNERLAQLQTDAGDLKDNGIANFLLKKILGEGGGRLAGSVVGGLGLVDVLASLVEGISKAGPAIKAMQYALGTGAAVQVWTMYQTHADEIRAGETLSSIEDMGYVAESLSDGFGTDQGGGGAEAAPYYQDIMGGQGVSTASLFPKAEAASPFKCNDGSYITTGLCPEMSLAATTGGANTVKELGEFFNSSGLGALAGAWNSTIGQVFDAASNFIGWVLNPLGDAAAHLAPDAIKDKLADVGKAIAGWFTEKLFVSFMTTDTSGGRMFEAAGVGANVAGNDFAHFGLGAGKIGDQMANEIRYARAVEKKQEFMEKPMFARMFDTSSSYSTVSQLALAMPSGATSTARSLSSTLLNPIGTVSAMFTGSKKVDAAAIKNLDLAGVTQYGYDKNDPIFKETNYEKWWTENNCDSEDVVRAWGESATMSSTNGSFENDQPNRCKLIESIATSNCAYIDDQCLTPEELGDQVDSGDGDGGGFGLRAASFNILHSPDGDVSARLRRSVDTLLHPPHEGGQVDVVGLQEVRPDQLRLLKSGEFGNQYEMFPSTTNRPDYEPNIVAWKKGKYKVIKEGFFDNGIRYFHGHPEQMPVVKLEDTASGEQFYFASIHNPRSGNDRGDNDHIRDDNSRKFGEYFARLKQQEPDTAMILVGDFNAGYQAAEDINNIEVGRRSFCILTNGIFWDAWHASKNIQGKCPQRSTVSFIDHIFVDRGTKVSKFFVAARGHTKNGSDHPTIFADIQVGETESGGGADGWSWPLRQKINNGPCYGGPREHAGMDMNSEIANNPVYAMHSGKVVRKGYDEAAGNYITIKADALFNGKPVYYSYEHLKPGSIRIDVGDKIGGGDVVAIAGTSGSVDLGASLAHLHIVTATTNTLGAYGSLGTTFNPMDILKDAGPPPEGYQCENR